MPARCQICAHAQLAEIMEALVSGTPRRRVARIFGVSHDALDRHWWKHVPDAIRAATGLAVEQRGPITMQALDGAVLLGLAAEQYERSTSLLDRLEAAMSKPGAKVDTRSVVAALREVRQSVETLAKLGFAVADRPSAPDASTAPEIDAAIRVALESRDIHVDDAAGDDEPSTQRAVPALMPPAE